MNTVAVVNIRVPRRMFHCEAIVRSVRSVLSGLVEAIRQEEIPDFMSAWIDAGCPIRAESGFAIGRHRVRLTQQFSDALPQSKRFYLPRGTELGQPGPGALEICVNRELNSGDAITLAVRAALDDWALPRLENAPETVSEWYQKGALVAVTFDERETGVRVENATH